MRRLVFAVFSSQLLLTSASFAEPQVTFVPLVGQGKITHSRPEPSPDRLPRRAGIMRFWVMAPYQLRAFSNRSPKVAAKPTSKAVPRLARPPATALMTLQDIEPWLQNVARQNAEQTRLIGVAQTHQKRMVWAVEVRPQDVPLEELRRVVIICRQHGDEPESTAAGVELLYQLLNDPSPRTREVLSRVAIFLVPLANPDGAARKRRHNALGQDLNRDWGQGRTGEVSALMYHLAGWQPDLVIDVHQWVPGDATQTPMAEASGGPFGYRVATLMAQAARQKGLRLASRGHSRDGTLCHRHWGANRGVPAILLETVHRPNSKRQRQVAIQTSVVSLQRALDLLAQ